MRKRGELPTHEEIANEALDEACEQIAALAGLQGSADPCIAQIHTALAKLSEAVSFTLSAVAVQRQRLNTEAA